MLTYYIYCCTIKNKADVPGIFLELFQMSNEQIISRYVVCAFQLTLSTRS